MKFNEGDLIYYKPLHIDTEREKGIVKKVYGSLYRSKNTIRYEVLILSSGITKLAEKEELEVRKYGE